MIRLPIPTYNIRDALSLCLTAVKGPLTIAYTVGPNTEEIINHSADYIIKAAVPALHQCSAITQGSRTRVIGDCTKNDFNRLYRDYFSKLGRPARLIYDELKASSNDICPSCGFGFVESLDHYLPKANYPIFSVLPQNLIPACQTCNKKKGSPLFYQELDLALHPYFDDEKFYKEIWVTAKVNKTSPVTIKFLVSPPDNWNEIDKGRVQSHFKLFGLEKSFSVRASSEVTTAVAMLRSLKNLGEVKDTSSFLLSIANSEGIPNSWKAVMYRALANDEWFCNGGGIVA